MRRHLGFDLSALTPEQDQILRPALDAMKFPSGRIKRQTGKKVPIAVSDLSIYANALDANGHGHTHRRPGEHGHLLGEPGHENSRHAALGLYWLPTAEHPAGRIEVGLSAMDNPDLAREVLLAEAAHAVDYGAMTDAQRQRIQDLFDHVIGAGNQPVGWFDELGEQDYWRWRGERWMGLFMAAFAPDLPRPLEARQPWQWSYDESDVRKVRQILRRPTS